MDKRQEYPTPPVGHKPSSYDLPSVIVIYTLVIVLGIGLCFCLRKANRLVPNRYSFPLILRSGNDSSGNNSRGRGRRQRQQDPFDDIDDEESRQGLLNDFSDQNDTDDELHTNIHRDDTLASNKFTATIAGDATINSNNHGVDDNNSDDEEDGFGDLQEASSPSTATGKTSNQANVFVVDDDDDDEGYGNTGTGSTNTPKYNNGKKSD